MNAPTPTIVHDPAPEDGVRAALETAAELLGRDRVTMNLDSDGVPAPFSLGPNISGFRARGVLGVLKPVTPAEVQDVVTTFRDTAGAVSLHPYSTGRNWGLGSREPVQDHVVALDLGGLDRIRDLDVDGGWAVVEPGVTQAKLAQSLEGTGRILNITASSAHTSVVGNILDRGVGLRRPRVEDLLGLEVVLPDGEMVHVGGWPGQRRPGPAYGPGLGPSLLHTFVQSGLGVVTAAAVRLLPRPEALRVLWLQFSAGHLGEAVDRFRRWVGQGLAHNSLRVYDPAAAAAYRGEPGHFLAHVCVDGAARAVDALTTIIEEEAAESGLFSAVWHADSPGLPAEVRPIVKLVDEEYAGIPDVEDMLLTTKTGHQIDVMDQRAGLVFFLPVVPLAGPAITRAQAIVEQVADEGGVRCGATYFTLDTELTLAIIAIKFDRGEREVRAAHAALDRLYDLFSQAGFTMCRLDVDHAEWAGKFATDPGERQLVGRIKELLDPHQVIASGRYH